MNISDVLSKIKGSFSVGGGGSEVVGLDIGASSIKIIELKRKRGKPALVKYGTLSLGPYARGEIGSEAKLPTDRLAKAVITALDAIGVRARKGTLSVPLKLSLIVTIEVPQSAEGKLDKIIPLEARKYIPVPPSEVDIAWSIISKPESGSLSQSQKVDASKNKIKVLIAAIHNSTIENFHDIAKKVGLAPIILEIETFSAIRSVLTSDKETTALVDIGSDAGKVVVVDEGSVTFSHGINRGSQSFTNVIAKSLGLSFKDAEKLKRKYGLSGSYNNKELVSIMEQDINYIFTETLNVIKEFEKNNSKKVEKVILIGGGAMLQGLTDKVKIILGKEVVLGDPFSKLELPTAVLAPVLKNSGPEFAVAIGLALRALEEL